MICFLFFDELCDDNVDNFLISDLNNDKQV